LAFTVVYLGEHYVVDVIAGLALAEAVWPAEPAMLPLVHLGLDVLTSCATSSASSAEAIVAACRAGSSAGAAGQPHRGDVQRCRC
jgi:hypothetical protein